MASDLFADVSGVTAMGSGGIYSQHPNASPSITTGRTPDFGGKNSGISLRHLASQEHSPFLSTHWGRQRVLERSSIYLSGAGS